MFLAVNQLIQALQSNSGVGTAVSALTASSNYLSTQSVLYGNAMDQVQSETTYENAATLQIAQQQNTLGGVDLATAANALSQDQTDTQATLEAISKISQDATLFTYLQ
jgi:flagellin-like hook-associated protein FlgL